MINWTNVMSYGKRVLAWGSIACVVVAMSFAVVKISKRPPPAPPPEPIVIEWEVNSKYGEKVTKLPNGLTLAVYHDDSEESSWSWSVSGSANDEKEAAQKVFKLGGVK